MLNLKQLKEIRKTQGLSLPRVAKKSGVCEGAISLIERGLCPNSGVQSVEAIANTLGWELVLQPMPTQGTTETHITKIKS